MSMTDFFFFLRYSSFEFRNTVQNLKEKLDKKEYANIVKTKHNQL